MSHLVTIRQLSIPGKVGASFWWGDALPHTNQLGFEKRRWNLEDLFSGSWISASVPLCESFSWEWRYTYLLCLGYDVKLIPWCPEHVSWIAAMFALLSVWIRLSDGKPPAGKGVDSLFSCCGSHFWVYITFCKVQHGDSVIKPDYYYFLQGAFHLIHIHTPESANMAAVQQSNPRPNGWVLSHYQETVWNLWISLRLWGIERRRSCVLANDLESMFLCMPIYHKPFPSFLLPLENRELLANLGNHVSPKIFLRLHNNPEIN